MKSLFRVVFLMICVMSISALGMASDKASKGLVDTGWLATHLKDQNIVILDVRAPQDEAKYQAGHIPGARFIGWDRVRSEHMVGNVKLQYSILSAEELQDLVRDAGITNDSLVVVASDWSSVPSIGFATRLFWTLQYYGVKATVLNGGFTKWMAEKLPLEQKEPAVKPSQFIAKPVRTESLANATIVADALKKGGTVLIDGRTAEFYRGDKKKDYVFAFGHIPGAINLPTTAVLDQKHGVMKDASELAKIFTAAGVTPDKRVIVYCDSGHLSTILWFALSNVLGYSQVQQFDSSLHEWTQGEKRPLEK